MEERLVIFETAKLAKEKGNKLIAEFMIPNWELLKSVNYNGEIERENLYIATLMCSNEYNDLKYHTSWSRLMPVVEKIEDLGYYTEINKKINGGNYVHISDNSLNKDIAQSYGLSSKINAVWLAVVEFIKWYNKNKSLE